MRIGILTSVDTRHRYFVQSLREHFDVVAVAYERTGFDPAATGGLALDDREERLVADHFAERARQESLFFGDRSAWMPEDGPCRVRQIEPGGLNSPATVGFLRTTPIDILVVYGTNLIKPPLLTMWSGRIVNLHLGLSPYYRGTATNFYPLLNEEPEYVGATIHLIDAGIDRGPIFLHARPKIVVDDAPHTIGCKAILAGISAMITVLKRWRDGRADSTPQWKPPNARLYLRKDYHPRQVVDLCRKLDAGLIPRYVERVRKEGDHVRLVSGKDAPPPSSPT